MIQDDRPAPPASYQALDLLCTLMTVLDEQGAVLFANAALENALGLSRRMLEGSELAACFTEPALLDKALRGAQDNDFAALRFEASLHRVGAMRFLCTSRFPWPSGPAMCWWSSGRWSSRHARTARSVCASRPRRTRS